MHKTANKNSLIKVNKNQAKNPLVQHLHPSSYVLTDTNPSFSVNEGFVEDFQINPGTAVLFLQLQFHLHKPLYIKDRFAELSKYRQHCQKYLLLMSDCPDELNYITDLEIQCIQFDVKLLICWSF